ncbi:hypothetical protein [Picosynechococcus sp. PCC 7117]|uniref:hypothetical protein n=1 Tax=Picosynechococcus sp. PCC 7117 TaxID=195498 RepID=UPI00081092F2|nr:hypothetical protein [Picosynechococcus sp. PCC 7117]ANV87344.1 hypothetical protein AWQ22_07655 [Picosynechococcus sp. PCC 7117]
MMFNRSFAIYFTLICGSFGICSTKAIAQPQCNAPLTEIVPQLLGDLPSYGNRVIQRARNLDRTEDSFSYIVIASPGNLTPLPLKNRQYTPTVPDTTEQIFFTTLETQYNNSQKISFENYYWLFLTPTNNGWAIANVVSSLANPDPSQPANPPRDASRGSVGQAVKLWLRDFYATCST